MKLAAKGASAPLLRSQFVSADQMRVEGCDEAEERARNAAQSRCRGTYTAEQLRECRRVEGGGAYVFSRELVAECHE